MRPDASITACGASNRRFLSTVIALDDDALRSPSRLPGWTRGHVVAHVVNKARAHTWIFGGPASGEVRALYPTGHDQDAAAAAGAARSPAELAADLHDAFDGLEAAWAGLDDAQWDAMGVMMAGPRTMTEIVSHHLRNVEVHHVDLDAGYEPAHWPAAFVGTELPKRLRDLTSRADEATLLAWLLGRSGPPDLGPW